MTKETPTNGELALTIANLDHRLFDDREGYLPRIDRQTTKTNGRVNRLERVAIILITAMLVLLADRPDILGLVLSLLP